MKPYKSSKLSVVVPVYRNADTLNPLTCQIFETAAPRFSKIELLFVNDGSPDSSRDVLEKISISDTRVKVINHVRNFGQHAALMTGLGYTDGDYVLFIDADLEESPCFLPDFMRKMEDGCHEIVVGLRSNDRNGLFKRLTARMYTWFHNMLADYKIVGNTTSMRLMTSRYTKWLMEFSERPYLPGFVSWIGITPGYVAMPWEERGRKSSYDGVRLLRHARVGIIGFSTKLLRISLLAGFVLSVLSFVYAALMIVTYFKLGKMPAGFTSIVVLISFLMGLQFIFMGILGEYLIEVFIGIKKRPEGMVYDTFGFQK